MAVVKNRHTWIWSLELAFLDLASLYFSLLLPLLIHGETFFHGPFSGLVFALLAVLNWTGLTIIDGYNPKREMSSWRYASEHFITMVVILLVSFFFIYSVTSFDESTKPSRSVLLISLILFAIISFHYRYVFSSWWEKSAPNSPVYVIAPSLAVERFQAICGQMRFRHPVRLVEKEDLKAFLLNLYSGVLSGPGADRAGRPSVRCEAIVLDVPYVQPDQEMEELLLRLNLHGVPIYPVKSFIETYFFKIDCQSVSVSDALDGTFRPDLHSPYGNLKTLIDFLFALVVLVAALPIMVVVALLIKIQDGGPIFFKQPRIGRFERPFFIFKFRTMKVLPEEGDLYTSKNDQRITRIGRFLRLTRLDELPQLWNVIRGEMSMIGPRAETDKLVEQYKQKIRLYNLRSMVKPGITGWAQVNYGYGANLNDTLEKLQYDLYYLKHYSPKLDAGIVLKTLYVVLSASGQ